MNKLLYILIVFLSFLLPCVSEAASLSFSPPSSSHAVGGTFSIGVYVGTSDQAMNAASGVVSFPGDKLEVVSLSKAGSIFSLWPEEPSFSNNAGTVTFEGVVLNPGYIGASGKIITITFRTKKEGQVNMSFSSGFVLANDGSGTNILSDLRVAVLTLTAEQKESISATVVAKSATGIENALGVTSSTHPDSAKWYANNTPEFSWKLPEGALEVRTLIGKSASGVPTVSYIPAISTKKVDELPDGTYYLSLQVRTESGWGAVSRYRVNIDTTPPKPFSITFPHGNESLEPQPVALFNTTDDGSGMSHYDIKIGSEEKPLRVGPAALSNPYVIPPQNPGTHTLFVTAIDSAGNTRSASADFDIKGIDAPVITYYPEKIEEGDIVKIRGTTYPNAEINLYIREGNQLISEEYTKSNSLGDFAIVATKGLDAGVYTFTARVTDERGAKSNETSPLTISVQSKVLSGLIDLVLRYLSLALLVIVSLGALVWGGAKLWFKIPRSIRRMHREAEEAERVSERAFKVLREGVSRHLMRLKKTDRKLTKEEVAFLEEFEDKLGEAEEMITKEIRDISES